MKVNEIFKNVEILDKKNFQNIDVTGICMDTEEVKNGDMFVCVVGTKVDGHNFANEAVKRGAKILVVEKFLPIKIIQILVKNTRSVVGILAGNFYKNAYQDMKIIGITGTNGKTTTTFIIKNILEKSGIKVGVIGTLGIFIGKQKLANNLTTPDPIRLHQIFYQMKKANIDVVVMEVSAHAIALEKIVGINFFVGILTNVTQDHLDFFETFENYASTKMSFINQKFCKNCIVNIDDKVGKDILENNKNSVNDLNLYSYGIFDADFSAKNMNYDFSGTSFCLKIENKIINTHTKLIGEFNIYNILSAVGACKILGVKDQDILAGIETVDFVSGRINVLKLPNNSSVVIDYAHTPDGLENILKSIKKISKNKVYCVFGCGGNRDKSKRQIMGQISAKYADFTVITSDNPRFENPEDIIKDIEDGIKKVTNQYICITNRVSAINYIIKRLTENDVVIIAGKGAENYLDIQGKKLPYSDFETVKKESQKIFNKEN